MPVVDFTLNQWALILLVFIIGWALGAASRFGGSRKWRRAYEEERALRLRDETRVVAHEAHPADRAVEPVQPARRGLFR